MEKKKMFYGWWIVIALTVNLALLGPAAVSVANLFQTSVTQEFGIANSTFAINNLIVLGSGIFFSPALSNILNGKHYKKVLMVGTITYALGLIGYGFAQNITMFYFLSLLVGFGYIATTLMPTSIFINNWFIEKRGLALSIAISGLGIGGFLLSPILTALITNLGWRMSYIIYGIVMLTVGLPMTLFVLFLKPEMKGLRPYGEEAAEQETQAQEEEGSALDLPAESSKTKPFFILLILGTALVGLVNNGGLGQFPPALQQLHGPAFASIIVSAYSIIGSIGKVLLGYVTDKFGIVPGIVYTGVFLVAAFIAMMFSENKMNVYLMVLFFGIGQAAGTVMPPIIAGAMFKGHNYSYAYGFVQGGQQLGMALGSLFVATIADMTGSYRTSWLLMAVISALVVVSWVGSLQQAKKQQVA